MSIFQKIGFGFILFLLVGIIVSTVIQQMFAEKLLSRPGPSVPLEQLTFSNGVTIPVEVMRTPQQITQGLSGRSSLGPAKGMLFLLPSKQTPSFWMKDMKFPLDLIWIDNGRIIAVTHNVPAPSPGTPESSLPMYKPSAPVTAVLEVMSGAADELGLLPPITMELVQP